MADVPGVTEVSGVQDFRYFARRGVARSRNDQSGYSVKEQHDVLHH